MRARAIFFGLWTGLAVAASAPAAEAKGLRHQPYTVKEGDTIYDLARRFGCTERDLEQSNELGEILPIGKKLRIPVCGKAGSEGRAEGKSAARSKERAEGRTEGRTEARTEPRTEPRSRRSSEPRDRGKREKLAQLARNERTTSERGAERSRNAEPARQGREEHQEHQERRAREARERRLTSALLATPPEVAAPLAATDQPVTRPSFDPTTGSIAAPAAPTANDELPPEIAAALSPSAAAEAEAETQAANEAANDALVPNLPRVEDEADGPSDHKLVLDGRRRAGEPVIDRALDEALPPAGQSIGKPWRGRLQAAARLGYGEGYVLRRPNRTYGTRTTVAHVERVLAELRHKFPALHTLAIGDLSLANGGPVSEHRSHQSGRDIDLGLCFHEKPQGYPEHFVVATEPTLDAAATWALISALADTEELDGGIEMIFLDFAVQGMVYRWAVGEGIDSERLARIFQYPHGRGSGLGMVRHAPNHADHLHARFRCAEDETGCR